MKKKLVAGLLCGTMVMSVPFTYVVSAEEQGEITEIFWQYPAQSELTEGFYQMEDALNEMMEKDIGVHVTFIPTDLTTSQQDATLMISAGEQLDVMLTAFTSVGELVDSGMILPLDEYAEEYAPYYMENCMDSVNGCYYDGKLYGLPSRVEQTFYMFGY